MEYHNTKYYISLNKNQMESLTINVTGHNDQINKQGPLSIHEVRVNDARGYLLVNKLMC